MCVDCSRVKPPFCMVSAAIMTRQTNLYSHFCTYRQKQLMLWP